MPLLEEYTEIIERDSAEISIIWKITSVFFYLLSTISGYTCSILYYMFWKDIFGGHCPFWVKLDAIPLSAALEEEYYDITTEITSDFNYTDWKELIFLQNEYQSTCQIYYIISCCSCVFGVIWVALFAMCGKGGYATTIYPAPWRVVVPALIFSVVLSIMTMFVSQDMQKGYEKFTRDIYKLFIQVSEYNITKTLTGYKECETVQDYVQMYNPHKHDVCQFFLSLDILSWIMAWSWIGATVTLVLRVLNCNDFRILKIKVYQVSDQYIQTSNSDTHPPELIAQTESQKEKGR